MNPHNTIHFMFTYAGINDISSVSEAQPFIEFGIDSLMNTEIRQLMGHEYNKHLTVADVNDLTLKTLTEMANQ